LGGEKIDQLFTGCPNTSDTAEHITNANLKETHMAQATRRIDDTDVTRTENARRQNNTSKDD
jgi:hypothetical protein